MLFKLLLTLSSLLIVSLQVLDLLVSVLDLLAQLFLNLLDFCLQGLGGFHERLFFLFQLLVRFQHFALEFLNLLVFLLRLAFKCALTLLHGLFMRTSELFDLLFILVSQLPREALNRLRLRLSETILFLLGSLLDLLHLLLQCTFFNFMFLFALLDLFLERLHRGLVAFVDLDHRFDVFLAQLSNLVLLVLLQDAHGIFLLAHELFHGFFVLFCQLVLGDPFLFI